MTVTNIHAIDLGVVLREQWEEVARDRAPEPRSFMYLVDAILADLRKVHAISTCHGDNMVCINAFEVTSAMGDVMRSEGDTLAGKVCHRAIMAVSQLAFKIDNNNPAHVAVLVHKGHRIAPSKGE